MSAQLNTDRRYANRFGVDYPIVVDDSMCFEMGALKDLSATGALLSTQNPTSVGSLVKLIPLSKDPSVPFELNGRVVRIFEDILEDTASRSRFLVALELFTSGQQKREIEGWVKKAGNA